MFFQERNIDIFLMPKGPMWLNALPLHLLVQEAMADEARAASPMHELFIYGGRPQRGVYLGWIRY